MKDIELPPLPDPKYIWHDADEPGEAELFEFEFSGAVDGRCDICERLYSGEQMSAYARAAVDADRAQRVPEGWKLVPVDPTEEMLCAGDDVLREAFRDRCIATQTIYDAMLSAAPAQPAPQPVERKPIGYVPISAVEDVALDGYLPVYKDHGIRE